ncbi:alpha/beta hydrolase-fold protein [Alteromonas sp. D210916BOD_24]|uniref:alpha/beta hydrolase n=1 Tax=Alteromonas sp. D210916BOD_24 TaxID=3157618 RepID=UPI00399CF29F
MNLIGNFFFGLLLLFYCSSSILAQQHTLEEHVLNSKILNEEQKISVYLPEKYGENSDHRYPVIYALDGKYYKQMVSAVIARFYGDWLIPETIVVTIDNENRIRDYTPSPHATANVPSGKADAFLDYIEKELIPFVDSNYQTSEFRILEGHSLGGLFSLYTVQARPELFTAHYAFSPSLHWGDNKTVEKIITYLSSRKSFEKFIYMNLGDEIIKSDYESRNTMSTSFLRLQTFFKENSVPGLRVKSEILKNLPHAATNISGLVNATNELYRNWVLPFNVMERGPEAISEHYEKLSTDLYHEVKPRMEPINYAADYMTNGVHSPEKGIKLLEYNAALYPDSAWVNFNLAKGYRQREEMTLAKKYGQNALKLIAQDNEELKSSIINFLEAL